MVALVAVAMCFRHPWAVLHPIGTSDFIGYINIHREQRRALNAIQMRRPPLPSIP
ncbi:hypothetical protein SCLCIDRAFT_783396 [Scleroderma citrinum Foug A]|uniref:Uncharacterized protein n=1 Tax=Scleroderma citrinum Foug A TaxID=1036808 RepID=A0A0C3E4H2_9AGAM|nr:hypothetical protein SCLCIDRAFT_783396 [Scleroderma citrinum Foug A]